MGWNPSFAETPIQEVVDPFGATWTVMVRRSNDRFGKPFVYWQGHGLLRALLKLIFMLTLLSRKRWRVVAFRASYDWDMSSGDPCADELVRPWGKAVAQAAELAGKISSGLDDAGLRQPRGWYRDPDNPTDLRYWTGADWSDRSRHWNGSGWS